MTDIEIVDMDLQIGATPDTITNDYIEYVSYYESADDLAPRAQVILYQDSGEHNAKIEIGKEIKIRGKYGSDVALATKWHGYITDYEITASNPTRGRITLQCIQYGYRQLVNNVVTESYTTQTAGAIIKDLLDTYTDLDTTNINVGTPADTFTRAWTDVPILDIIADCLELVAGTFYIDQSDNAYYISKKSASSGKSYGPGAFSSRRVRKSDAALINDVTVNGAEREEIDQQQTTQNGVTNPTTGNAERYKVTVSADVTKISKIIIYVDKTGQVGTEGLYVRVQADDGTGNNPVSETDFNADICRKHLGDQFLASGGETTFVMDDNYLETVERDYWILVESDGATGVDVGIDTGAAVDAKLYFKMYHYDTATGTDSDATSKTAYGTYEDVITNRELKTDAQCTDVADGIIDARKGPPAGTPDIVEVDLLASSPYDDVDLRETAILVLPNEGITAGVYVLVRRDVLIDARRDPKHLQVTDTYTFTERAKDEGDVIKGHSKRIRNIEQNIATVQRDVYNFDYDDLTNKPTGMVGGARHGEAAHKEVWDYVYIPIVAFEPQTASFSFGFHNYWLFGAGGDAEIYASIRIPDHIDLSATDPEIIIRYHGSTSPAGDKIVRTNLSYNSVSVADVSPSAWDETLQEDLVILSTYVALTVAEKAYQLDRTKLAAGDDLHIELQREASDGGDTYDVGTWRVTSMLLRFRTKKMGEEV
jgi:hypothetical protein